jgi:hypothetical protein
MNPHQIGEMVNAGVVLLVGLGLVVAARRMSARQGSQEIASSSRSVPKRSMLVVGFGLILFSAVRMLQIGQADPRESSAPAPFSSADGQYRVAFPGPPETKVVDQTIDGVALRMNSTSATTDNGNWYFSATFKEYPKGSLVGVSLDGTKQQLSTLYGSAAKSDTKLAVSGVEAREFVFPVKGGLATRCRIFIIDDRLYNVMVVAPSAEIDGKRSTDFLESFKLLR